MTGRRGKTGSRGTGNGECLSNTDEKYDFLYVLVGMTPFPCTRGRVRDRETPFPVPHFPGLGA